MDGKYVESKANLTSAHAIALTKVSVNPKDPTYVYINFAGLYYDCGNFQ
jgi:hypothetical protein